MIRDSKAAKDGWFWGWYGWPDVKSGWHVDFPPVASNPLPFMGFGQYCLNCHASARDNQTFASPNNIKGQPGTYLFFLTLLSLLAAGIGVSTAKKRKKRESSQGRSAEKPA